MTVTNQTTQQTYPGTGSQTNFPIPYAFISGEPNQLVTLIQNDGTEVVQVITTNYTLDDPNDPTLIQMITPPAADEFLRVERVTPKTQDTDLVDGGPFPGESIEDQLDRLTFQTQELQTGLDAVTPAAPTPLTTGLSVIPDWVTATAYIENQSVIANDGTGEKHYRATTAHTSGNFATDFGLGRWELVPNTGEKGDTGDTGLTGATGATGAQGIQGNPGNDGVDGIFSQIASQAEAENGTNNDKGMTPLRTKQAIDSQVPALAVITQLVADLDQAELDIQENASAITALQNEQQGFGKFNGSQIIQNAAGPVELLGKDAAVLTGKGDKLARDGDGTNVAKVFMSILRKTDTETRFSSFILWMQYVDDLWYIARDDTFQLKETLDLDGVTLTVATDLGTKVGQVSYTTDLMAGANHDVTSEIKWLGQEISVGV